MLLRPPSCPLFPYTTLFRSKGNTVEEVSRRAKHAVLRLRSGHRLVVQPRMTGSLIVHDRPLTKDESRYRSEEHTSELQSHHDLVCRLLLAKKNRTKAGNLAS